MVISEPVAIVNVPKVPKKCMGRFRIRTNECNGEEVQKAVNKPLQTKFGAAIFPGLMTNNFFSNISEAMPFRNEWDIAMHLTINFNTLHNIFAICFEPTVEIM